MASLSVISIVCQLSWMQRQQKMIWSYNLNLRFFKLSQLIKNLFSQNLQKSEIQPLKQEKRGRSRQELQWGRQRSYDGPKPNFRWEKGSIFVMLERPEVGLFCRRPSGKKIAHSQQTVLCNWRGRDYRDLCGFFLFFCNLFPPHVFHELFSSSF